jgi:hypothetical protein
MTMTFRRTFLAVGMAAAISLGTSALALAHGPGATSTNHLCGWRMGPMMGQGQMGQGQMPMMGQGMGPGMMGQGMGPGMMGQGMGPGMMGQGMGPGMMGQGMGPGMMQPLRQDLSAEDVKHMMEHRLAWNGNPNVKVGKVEKKDDDTIIAEIVTQDGSLVQSLEVDRHTGWMRPAQ